MLGINKSVRGFANSWICFYPEALPNFGLYPMLIAYLQSEIVAKFSCYISKSCISKVTFICTVATAFSSVVPILYE